MNIKYAIMLFSTALSAGLAFASKPLSDEEYLRANGGMCQIKGKGWVAAVDCRKTPDFSDYEHGQRVVAQELGTTISNVPGGLFSVLSASAMQRQTGANAAIFIIDDDKFPMTLSCPEERWSMLNAANAKADGASKEKFKRRMSLLFERQCCRALGCDEGVGTETCFHTVLKPADLDDIKSTDLTLNATTSISDTMPLRGMEPIDWGTYRDACEAGRAHAPTNDIQRKVWKEVHSIPDKPITIEFDPKKDK